MDQEKEEDEFILTTFDSSLFDFKDENYQLAKTAIAKFQERKISLIAVTKKIQAEIEDLKLALGYKQPLIVEYSIKVLISLSSDRFKLIRNCF
jgi:predicted mannosyl-3-phosphoglycerate phosphatase (HAD superfamily)